MIELTPMQMQMTAAKEELRYCEEWNRLYGLTLTEENIAELVQCRGEALKVTGRVEFGGGILPKLIHVFAGSPYVDNGNYVSVLAELQDAFYFFKNECQDRFSDDELIEFMEKVFNGKAAGAAELLTAISLEELCWWARNDGLNRYEDEEDFWG